MIDVVIQDAKADLNVYIDTLPDGSKRHRDVEDPQQGSSCCTPKTEPSGCCIQPMKSADGHDLTDMVSDLAGLDLNEWVGK